MFNPIPQERFYRHLTLIERLEQIQSELALLSESLTGYGDAAEKVALDMAEAELILSVKRLHEARQAVRQRIQPELLAAELEASIELLKKGRKLVNECQELVNESPERLRREQV